MYIESVPNRNSPPAILLRESYRENGRVLKRTIGNISHWPPEKIDELRAKLSKTSRKSASSVSGDQFAIRKNIPHGHVEAIIGTVKKLGLAAIISSRRCRQLDLVLGMIAERIIHPASKLGTSRLWNNTTLAKALCIEDSDVKELYSAMDWLLARQNRIEKKLAALHLSEGGLVVYAVTSSYYEGKTCSLIAFGHNKDRKRGKKIIVYGAMTDSVGRPVAVQVYPGNTADSTTVPDQVDKLRNRFGLNHVVLVGDRGMLTQTQIDNLKKYPGLSWISALHSKSIRNLMDGGSLQMSLFDERNLAEITSPLFPGERLIACFNPALAIERKQKREALLAATEKELLSIAAQVSRRTKKPLDKAEIGRKAGAVINAFKVAKHFTITIGDGSFSYSRREDSIAREADMAGIYIIRTSEPATRLSSEDTVRSYKSLSQVEQAFRTLKSLDILVRPIRHRVDDRVRAHIFLCSLAYYVEWHMRKALAQILFIDDELDENRKKRNPVQPAVASDSAKLKKKTKLTPDGFPVHSFDTLLEDLGSLCRNLCYLKSDPDSTFYQDTDPSSLQLKALQLLGICTQ